MIEVIHKVLNTIKDAEEDWDEAVLDHPFLNRNILTALEITNPCGQQYHLFYKNDLNSVIVTYRLNLNIFTYWKGNLSIPVRVIGIPCSVSQCGYVIGTETQVDVYIAIQNLKGATLCLNIPDDRQFKGFSSGETLPSYKMKLSWLCFDEYLTSLRSHYRYRIRKALQKGENLKINTLVGNRLFDESLYALYLEVYNRSEFKLEKLPITYFKEFPANITVFSAKGQKIAFIQYMENKDELLFLFGGMDYATNGQYDTYMNMLLEIIRIGIKRRVKGIDLGQTAGKTKMRLGATASFRGMAARHANPMINFIVGKLMPTLSLRLEETSYNVYKGD